MNEVLKPDLVSVVTAHMVYFCALARSEIFQKNAMKSGVGCGQFDAGVNGLSNKFWLCCSVITHNLSRIKLTHIL